MTQRGINLIEQVVILGVLSIIAAMMAPAASEMRDQGRRSLCTNNLRQHGIAWALYLDEHAETFPRWGNVFDSRYGREIAGRFLFGGGSDAAHEYAAEYRVVNRYLGIRGPESPKTDLFRCPADTIPHPVYKKTIFEQFGSSYALNAHLIAPDTRMHVATMRTPRSLLVLEHCAADYNPGHVLAGEGDGNPGGVPVMVLYVDGHVAGPLVAWTDFSEDFKDDPKAPAILLPN